MTKYGPINSASEMKGLQTTVHGSDVLFVGIDKHGFAYVYENGETRKLHKDEIGQILSLDDLQVQKLIRKRGDIIFSDISEGSSKLASSNKLEFPEDKNKGETESVEGLVASNVDKFYVNLKNEGLFVKHQPQNVVVERHELDIPVGRENHKVGDEKVDDVDNETLKLDLGKESNKPMTVPTHTEELLSSEVPDKKSLKQQVRELKREIAWLKENTVTRDQMLEILKTLKGE